MDRGRIVTVLLTALATVVVLGLGAVLYIRSGRYDIAAQTGHTAPVTWALETLMERSIEEHAEGVPEPPPVDSAALEHGFDHFHAMCVQCHGAPGVEPDEFAEGLHPQAPELSDEAEEWTERELFWIIKHGIKMTGMPAFGPTHSDEELWGVVAFMQRLPEMTPAEYRARVAALEAAGGGHHDRGEPAGHTHAPGTAAHEH